MPAWAWILIGVMVCGCMGVPIIAAILFPVFMQAKVAAQKTQTLSNMKQLGLSEILFQSDHEDRYANVRSEKAVFALLAPYLPTMARTRSANPKGHEILFNFKLAGHTGSQLKSLGETIVFYEAQPWYDGKRCVEFADGHAKLLDAQAWIAAQYLMQNPLKDAKATKPLSDKYQGLLSKLYDKLMAEDTTQKPLLTADEDKLVSPDFATGEPEKDPPKS